MSLYHWRFHEEFTVVEAALIIAGADPKDYLDVLVERKKADNFFAFIPDGFEGYFSNIKNAVLSGRLKATIRYRAEQRYIAKTEQIKERRFVVNPEPDWEITTIFVEDLKKWLISRNLKPEFFFDECVDKSASEPDYMKPEHPRYSVKLAAAVKVWLAMEASNLLAGKAVIPTLKNWLESRYLELGITYKGKFSKTAIEDCAKVANWDQDGGATKTP
jgi:hypothetical protein